MSGVDTTPGGSIPGFELKDRFRALLERWDSSPRQGLPQVQSGRAAYTWRGFGEDFPSLHVASEPELRAAWKVRDIVSRVGVRLPAPPGSVVRGFTLSPDGLTVAALLSTPRTELAGLWILAEDTAPIRIPGISAWYSAPVWEPNGAALWILSGKPPQQRITSADLRTGGRTEIPLPGTLESEGSGSRLSLSLREGMLRITAATPGRDSRSWQWRDETWVDAPAPVPSRLTLAESCSGTTVLLDGTPVHRLSPAEHVTSFAVHAASGNDVLWMHSASPERPSGVYCLELPPAEVPLPLHPQRFVHRRLFAKARDGVDIPLTVSVRAADLAADGLPLRPLPLILTCYGGFGVKHRTEAEPSVPAWLESGGVYVAAHLRGGGELGDAWHDAGRGPRKLRTVLDLVDVAEFLAAAGWSTPAQTVAFGASHGGLVVTSAALLSPASFGGVVAVAPLLDTVNLDRHGLGTQWLHEFGADGECSQQERALYSPLQVAAGLQSPAGTPPILCCVLGRDERVDNHAAVDFVDAVRRHGGSAWLLSEHDGGHGQRAATDVMEFSATVLAFAARVSGMLVRSGQPAPPA
ncbi:S9 family peptidase [Paenarthrobacter nitroguajacolicus]|uniref:S9 family peptidase n=1 Tax=Paenarthrobacter nitroguajacolicus TaxID=211146 RepID=A0A558HAR3_PAENT|nr:prolyl oligopeptidase family serine peptidase [Paenarthrobacter nitroguajacolicus]TVU66229.1 S9 family peptidase [Paenarthrobacter nitroguajacolicus]